MLALVAKRAGRGPRLDDEIDAFLEQFAIERGIGVVGELLGARAAHPSGDQASARDEIDHGEFFRQAQRIANRGHRIAEQDIFSRLVVLASIEASTSITAPRQNGVP